MPMQMMVKAAIFKASLKQGKSDGIDDLLLWYEMSLEVESERGAGPKVKGSFAS